MRRVWLFLMPMALWAQTAEFSEILAKVMANNKGLQAQALEVGKAEAQAKEAGAYNLGRLYLSEQAVKTNHPMHAFGIKLAAKEANYGDLGMGEFMASMMGGPAVTLQTRPDELNNPDAVTGYDTALTYEIPLFTGFKLARAKEAAKLQAGVKAAEFSHNEKALAKEALLAYNGAVAAGYFIEAVAKGKEATSEYVQMAQDLKGAGMVTDTDVLQAQQRHLEMTAMLIEAQNNRAMALAYLRFLSGDADLSGVGEFENLPLPDRPLQAWQQNALESRDDLRAMQGNRDTAKAAVGMQRAAYYPTIGAFAKTGVADTTLSIDGDKDYYMVGLGVTWDLFDGGVRGSKLDKAKLEWEQARLGSAYMQEGVRLEVERAFLDLKAKAAVIDQKAKAQTLAEEVLEKSRIMYQNGLITMIELLIKEADALKARAEHIKARFDKAQAAAEFYQAVGKKIHEETL